MNLLFLIKNGVPNIPMPLHPGNWKEMDDACQGLEVDYESVYLDLLRKSSDLNI